MAIAVETLDTSLRLKLVVGTNDKGDPIFKTRSYKDIRDGADPEDIYEVAQGLGDLISSPVSEIQLLQNSSLIEE
ncbi:MAG: DUF1659 domain-containing protein [Bacillota bacterium]